MNKHNADCAAFLRRLADRIDQMEQLAYTVDQAAGIVELQPLPSETSVMRADTGKCHLEFTLDWVKPAIAKRYVEILAEREVLL